MNNPLSEVMALCNRLEAASIDYRLSHFRPDSVAFRVRVPGQFWEIEYFADGHVEIERFLSDGSVFDGEAMIQELMTEWVD